MWRSVPHYAERVVRARELRAGDVLVEPKPPRVVEAVAAVASGDVQITATAQYHHHTVELYAPDFPVTIQA